LAIEKIPSPGKIASGPRVDFRPNIHAHKSGRLKLPLLSTTGENKMLIVKGEKRKANGKNKTPKPRGLPLKPRQYSLLKIKKIT
jgi:hypothetical protein